MRVGGLPIRRLGITSRRGPELTGTRDERERQLPQIFGRRSMYCRVPKWRAEEYQWNRQSRVQGDAALSMHQERRSPVASACHGGMVAAVMWASVH